MDISLRTNIYLNDEFEEEDDFFYRELKRQVLELTSEDDEENQNPNNTMQSQKSSVTNRLVKQASICYYDWPKNEDYAASAPAWILNLWRTGNGTGVFIPQTTAQSRRRNRPRRQRNGGARVYKKVEKSN